MKTILFVASLSTVTAIDACGRICLTLPDCTDGSYNKNGFCHGLFFLTTNTICVHNTRTRDSCPSSLRKVDYTNAQSMEVSPPTPALRSSHTTSAPREDTPSIPVPSGVASGPVFFEYSTTSVPAENGDRGDTGNSQDDYLNSYENHNYEASPSLIEVLESHVANVGYYGGLRWGEVMLAVGNDLLAYEPRRVSTLDDMMTKWTALGGPLLLELAQAIPRDVIPAAHANTASINTVIWSLLIIGTRLDTVLVDRASHADFWRHSGLRRFCETHAEPIRGVLHLATVDRVRDISDVVSVLAETWGADMPTLCPGLLNTPRLRAIAFTHRGQQVLSQQTWYITIPRATAFTTTAGLLRMGYENRVAVSARFKVRFSNEFASGEGVFRDWISEVSQQIMLPEYSLLYQQTEAPFLTKVSDEYRSHDLVREDRLVAIGRIIGIALLNDGALGFNFPMYYLSYMLERPVSLKDIATDEPAVYNSLKSIMNMSSAELADVRMELKSTGEEVTEGNRAQFVQETIDSLISAEQKECLKLIKRGLFQAAPRSLFSGLLSASDVKEMIYGAPRISISELKEKTYFESFGNAYSMESDQIKWLFRVLDSFDQTMRHKYLLFVSGSSRLPVGGIAASTLEWTIVKGPADDQRLPTSQTCFNSLTLPEYSTEKILRKKLILAINSDLAMGNA